MTRAAGPGAWSIPGSDRRRPRGCPAPPAAARPPTMPRDTFCSYCGTRFADTTAYPRMCTACGAQTWANPIPVAVLLLPVIDGARTGLLVVRRAIPPVGKLALVGGFVEDHESWQAGAAREL